MKIYAASLDELKARRATLQTDNAKRKDRNKSETYMFDIAIQGIEQSLKEQILSGLNRFNLLHFDIDASVYSGSYINIRIECNHNDMYSDKNALSWEYKVEVNPFKDGLEKSSGSYSGLNAVTPEQLESLRESYEALVYLNNIDWENVLNIAIPNRAEFIDKLNESEIDNIENEIEDLDKDIVIEELTTYLDKPILVKLDPYKSKEYLHVNTITIPYIALKSDTPKFYKYAVIPARKILLIESGDMTVEEVIEESIFNRVKKVHVLNAIKVPIETLQ